MGEIHTGTIKLDSGREVKYTQTGPKSKPYLYEGKTSINITKTHDGGEQSKGFPIEGTSSVQVIHNTHDGQNIIYVVVNGRIEFKYDVNDPETEIVGYHYEGSFPEGTII
jgi:hypothetical protein